MQLTEQMEVGYQIDKLVLRIERLEDQIELLHKRAGDPMECMRRFFERHRKDKEQDK